MKTWSVPRCLLGGLLLGLCSVGCGQGDLSLDEVDPEAAPAAPTWSDHVLPIMERRCTACHSEGAQSGDLGGLGLDICRSVKRRRGSVMGTAVRDESMPPGGAERLTSWEALTLERWYAQGAPCD